MGNRAVITTLGNEKGIYIHWNGGRDSVEPILWYCKNLMPKTNFTHSDLERIAFVMELVGLNPEMDDVNKLDCDNYDNGVYVVKNYKIVGRLFMRYDEQKTYNFTEFVMWINEHMPRKWQKSEEEILKTMCLELPDYCNADGKTDFDLFMESQNVGDEVYYEGTFHKIIGRNDSDNYVNGSVRKGQLFFNYTASYEKDSQFKIADENIEKLMSNPNSYFHDRNGLLDVKIVNQRKYYKLAQEWAEIKAKAK